ncbi:porin [Vibrio comitans]|uniref:Porin n=1 Tax=Vibrio comitans NBRC 102076 TaxID=1219078 RepID=A0A4Y3IHP4_9VIBR|nr:porin [Vibrio comitans]GEA58973.1 porin [Vibrio comitans NBRC 102076]
MKKTLLALAVASVAATSVNATEIYKTEDGSIDFYGQLRTQLEFNDSNEEAGDPKAHTATLNSGSSRTGIKGAYGITDTVDVIGLVELGVGIKDSVDTRLHYIGFQSDFGTVTFGKQWLATDDVWGADYSYFYGGSALRGETLNGGRHDSAIKYTFDGENFWVKATWGLDEDESEQEVYDAFVGTSFGDLALHAGGGYTQDFASELSNTYAEFTAEYGIGDHLIGFTYYWAELADEGATNTKIDENGLSLAGIFQMTEKTALYGGYEYTMQEVKNTNLDEDGTVIYLGVEHKFNSWARVYAEYAYLDGTTLGYTSGDDTTVAPGQTNDAFNNFGIGARFYW